MERTYEERIALAKKIVVAVEVKLTQSVLDLFQDKHPFLIRARRLDRWKRMFSGWLIGRFIELEAGQISQIYAMERSIITHDRRYLLQDEQDCAPVMQTLRELEEELSQWPEFTVQ